MREASGVPDMPQRSRNDIPDLLERILDVLAGS